jgi:signal transduction histidine kinase/CheY-like chemotaxis protein
MKKEKEKGDQLTKVFAHNCASSLYRLDFYSLENYVIQMQNLPLVKSARVYDNSNRVVTPSSRGITEGKNNSITIKDLLTYNDLIVGKVEVDIDLSDSMKQINTYRYKTLFSSFFIILAVLLILYLLININVLMPLSKVIASISKITKGDLDQEIPVHSNDEIGDLSRSFNLMTESLKENISITAGVFASMPGVFIVTNKDFALLKWNSFTEDFFEIDGDLENKIIWEAIPFFERYKEVLREVIDISNPIRLYRETYAKKPNHFFEVFLFPLKTNKGNGLVVSVNDVTETESINEQFRQTQKMEAVESLAGGLAHDFNNILCGISGTLSLLKHKLHFTNDFKTEDVYDYIQTIESSTNRAENLVQQFLTLSKKQNLYITKVDLNEAIQHIYNICQNTFDKSVKMEVNCYPEPAITIADQTQIEQVLLNLALNGYQAMATVDSQDREKILSISIEKFEADRFFVLSEPSSMEITYWKITVSDTGIGISKENMLKVFDPFFTTKNIESSTGLGLSITYNIVKQHNGFIKFFSEENVGTNFVIYLPYLSAENSIVLLKGEKERFYVGNKECILIADDEPIVLQIAKEILEESKYTVITAIDGQEAVRYFKELHKTIDLVILDINMPKLNGRDTYIQMKKIKPDIQVLLCSGLKKDARIDKIMDLGIQHYIQKPFTLHKLSKKVYDIFQGLKKERGN